MRTSDMRSITRSVATPALHYILSIFYRNSSPLPFFNPNSNCSLSRSPTNMAIDRNLGNRIIWKLTVTNARKNRLVNKRPKTERILNHSIPQKTEFSKKTENEKKNILTNQKMLFNGVLTTITFKRSQSPKILIFKYCRSLSEMIRWSVAWK